MNSNWAEENLQTIRTLMERSAVYRRALAPSMVFAGVIGIVAAAAGALTHVVSVRGFTGYWMIVGLVTLIGEYFLVRRQAVKDGEPFWSPPTQRVTEVILPALFVGMITGLVFMGWLQPPYATDFLPTLWMVLYGCALHAAGFFMPRGIRLFAWVFIAGACAMLLGVMLWPRDPSPIFGHAAMGLFFGVLQLAYGTYLYFTEKQTNDV